VTRRVMYVHTIWGKPAFYHAGDRMVWIGGRRHVIALVPTLRQIRREQQASIKTSLENGWAWDMSSDYGYVRVEVPE
jgi:hypothetical protein